MRLYTFMSFVLILVFAGCSGDSNGEDCSGCLIDSICYPDQVTNPDNPCQICNPGASTTYWNNNDGAGCDDGVFCNGVDLCSGGTCSDHAGDPCDALLMCDEDNDECVAVCTGCQIDASCFTNGQTNPQNACQVCNTSVSTTAWQANDGASCDDGLFCTGIDTCSGETCFSPGDPCDPLHDCWESGGGECCVPNDHLACNAAGDLVSADSCGHELSIVEDCPDPNGTCDNLMCVCLPGWYGDDCDECDLVNDTVCQPSEKCTFLVESTGPLVGQAGCAPDGTVDPGDACTFSGSPGIDDCKKGSLCSGDVCKLICTTLPDTCPGNDSCARDNNIFEHSPGGLCEPGCDLFGQDCTNGETCYLLLRSEGYPTACAPAIPEPDPPAGCGQGLDRPGLQGECCTYINSCDTGYGCVQATSPSEPGLVCAWFCDPTGTLGTDDCSSVLGAEYFCVSIRDFYSDKSDLDAAYGFCLDEADWGPPECWNEQQDADEFGVDCCDDPPGACPCVFTCQ